MVSIAALIIPVDDSVFSSSFCAKSQGSQYLQGTGSWPTFPRAMDRHAGMCPTMMGREMSTCIPQVGMLCVLVAVACWTSVKMMRSTLLHCFSGYFFAHLPLTERLGLQNSPSSCGHNWTTLVKFI